MATAEEQWTAARAGDGTSDLARIASAFADLRGRGFVAEGALGDTSSEGWDEVATMSDDDKPSAVFWNTQSHDEAFDADGNLVGDLPLQWSGDGELIVAAIKAKGFDVAAPASERDAIVVRPAGAGAGGGGAASDKDQLEADVSTLHETLEAAGWTLGRDEYGVQFVRAVDGGELQTFADYDRNVLVLKLVDGDGERALEREVPYGKGGLRAVLDALVAVQDDVTAANAEEALQPVVAAAP